MDRIVFLKVINRSVVYLEFSNPQCANGSQDCNQHYRLSASKHKQMPISVIRYLVFIILFPKRKHRKGECYSDKKTCQNPKCPQKSELPDSGNAAYSGGAKADHSCNHSKRKRP